MHICMYVYLCVHQWEEFGGRPQGSYILGLQRTVAASGRNSSLSFDHVITNGQYRHSEGNQCRWGRIRDANPVKNDSEHLSRLSHFFKNRFSPPLMEYFRNLFYGVKQGYYRLDSCRRRIF